MKSRTSETGAAWSIIVLILLAVGVAISFIFFVLGVVINPGYLGVRQVNFGPGQGLHDRGLAPGLHWRIPFYSDIHLVPTNLQLLDFHREGKEHAASFNSLEVQTADRATVDVDATIVYRLYSQPGEDEELHSSHGGPADLIKRLGSDPGTWITKVRSTADDVLKRELGRISTGQFYDPAIREKQVDEALKVINVGDPSLGMRGLLELGIKVEAILLRRYVYRDERIENAIFQKNLQDQEEALNVALRRLAEAQAKSADEEARGEARNITLKIEGEQKSRVTRSEADLYEAKKKAEADLTIAKAQAEVDKLRASALAQSKGAQIVVAREIAAILGSLKGGVVSGFDPYDLKAMMKKLGVEQEEAKR